MNISSYDEQENPTRPLRDRITCSTLLGRHRSETQIEKDIHRKRIESYFVYISR